MHSSSADPLDYCTVYFTIITAVLKSIRQLQSVQNAASLVLTNNTVPRKWFISLQFSELSAGSLSVKRQNTFLISCYITNHPDIPGHLGPYKYGTNSQKKVCNDSLSSFIWKLKTFLCAVSLTEVFHSFLVLVFILLSRTVYTYTNHRWLVLTHKALLGEKWSWRVESYHVSLSGLLMLLSL